MGAALDRMVALWLQVTPVVLVWSGLMALAMVLCLQPARRCLLGMAASLGMLAVPWIVKLGLAPRLDLAAHLGPPPWPGSWGVWSSAAAAESLSAWRRWGAAAYGLGVLWQLSWLGLGWWGGLWLVWTSSSPSAATIAFFRDLVGPRRLGPRLRVSERARVPRLFGGLPGTILIPPALDRPVNREALRLALLHELAHDRRRDSWWALLAGLCQALWFFWPPIWWLRAQLRLDQEFLADRRAADQFGLGHDYAAALVGQSGPVAVPEGTVRGVGRAGAWFGGSALSQRVLMLLRCPFEVELSAPAWFRAGTSLVAAFVVLALSGVTLSGLAVAVPPAHISEGRFHAPRVDVGPEHSPAPLTFPLVLPDEFELTVEALADRPEALAGSRLAGYALPEPIGPPREEGRYQVRLVRRAGSVRLWVDDEESKVDERPRPDSSWLTVTPAPGQPLELRDLVLTWDARALDNARGRRYE